MNRTIVVNDANLLIDLSKLRLVDSLFALSVRSMLLVLRRFEHKAFEWTQQDDESHFPNPFSGFVKCTSIYPSPHQCHLLYGTCYQQNNRLFVCKTFFCNPFCERKAYTE